MLISGSGSLLRASKSSQAYGSLGPKPTSYRLPQTHRGFSRSAPRKINDTSKNGPFRRRLLVALRETKINWAPVPIGFGIAFLGLVQLYKVRRREKSSQDGAEVEESTPKKRKRIRPSGPWYVGMLAELIE